MRWAKETETRLTIRFSWGAKEVLWDETACEASDRPQRPSRKTRSDARWEAWPQLMADCYTHRVDTAQKNDWKITWKHRLAAPLLRQICLLFGRDWSGNDSIRSEDRSRGQKDEPAPDTLITFKATARPAVGSHATYKLYRFPPPSSLWWLKTVTSLAHQEYHRFAGSSSSKGDNVVSVWHLQASCFFHSMINQLINGTNKLHRIRTRNHTAIFNTRIINCSMIYKMTVVSVIDPCLTLTLNSFVIYTVFPPSLLNLPVFVLPLTRR